MHDIQYVIPSTLSRTTVGLKKKLLTTTEATSLLGPTNMIDCISSQLRKTQDTKSSWPQDYKDSLK